MSQDQLCFIGAAFGLSGADPLTAEAATVFRHSAQLAALQKAGLNYQWSETIYEQQHIEPLTQHLNKQQSLPDQFPSHELLAKAVYQAMHRQQKFCVIGGDHSCAAGTWSGAATALKTQDKNNELGLLWIDAHMDAHTHDSTLTGNVHGMPVAALLGQGTQGLTHILSTQQKIKAENIYLIGVRSFEPAEERLLKALGVNVFTNIQVQELGIQQVMQQAYQHISRHSSHIGISIDIDGLDPKDAPATGTPVPNGISAQAFIPTLSKLAKQPNFIGYEIVEYSPHLDHDSRTIKILQAIIAQLEQLDSLTETTKTQESATLYP